MSDGTNSWITEAPGNSGASNVTKAAASTKICEGALVGDYEVLEEIGAGGVGRVYRARHIHMDRIVALKVLAAQMASSEEAVKRFLREVKSAAKLLHPNIVTAFDAGELQSVYYLVMEFIDGTDLEAVVSAHGSLNLNTAVDFTIQAAKGLEYAHSENLVHRDIKPSNLMLDQHGVVKILDMGLARQVELNNAMQDTMAHDDALTQFGAAMGTIGFMAPEQSSNAKGVDNRADIYSLGCTLYYLITGEPVFKGNLAQIVIAHLNEPVPSLIDANKQVSPRLDSIFQKMMEKDPEKRYQTMHDVISDLRNSILEGSPREPNQVSSGDQWKVPVTTNGVAAHTNAFPASSNLNGAVQRTNNHVSLAFDLGYSNLRIAKIDKKDKPATHLSSHGSPREPSVVYVQNQNFATGRDAIEKTNRRGRFVKGLKHLLGVPNLTIPCGENVFTPEALLGMLLHKSASKLLESENSRSQSILTVPVAANAVQRMAYKNIGRIAGSDVLDLVNDTTAAAFWYGWHQGLFLANADQAQKVCIVQLGSSSLGFSICDLSSGSLKVIACSGDQHLGGIDWDEKIIQYTSEAFIQQCGADPREDPVSKRHLPEFAIKTKHRLSLREEANLNVKFKDQAIHQTLSRKSFKEISKPLLERMNKVLQSTLQHADLDWSDIDQLITVGESTRMPMIHEMLVKLSKKEPVKLPEDAIVHGSLLYGQYATHLGGDHSIRIEVKEANALNTGVVAQNRKQQKSYHAVLIPANTVLPATIQKSIKTSKQDQESIVLHLVQGNSSDVEACSTIGDCEITLQPGLPAGTSIPVVLQLSRNGIIHVFESLEAAEQGHSLPIDYHCGLSEDEIPHIQDWLETALLCSDY